VIIAPIELYLLSLETLPIAHRSLGLSLTALAVPLGGPPERFGLRGAEDSGSQQPHRSGGADPEKWVKDYAGVRDLA
jgi:hypothetical protein